MRRLILAIAVELALVASACGVGAELDGQLYDPSAGRGALEGENPGTNTSTVVGHTASGEACPLPDLGSIDQRILKPRCATAGCHAGETPAQGLALDLAIVPTRSRLLRPSTELISGMPLVTPSQTGASYLYLKVALDNPLSGGPMPPSAKLDPCEVKAIKQWIEAGAR